MSSVYILVPCFLACSSGEAYRVTEHVVRHDSAGISIVESATPAWRSDAHWRLESEPYLSIGAADGDAGYLFDEIAAAYRLSDGRIVVADRASAELRYFSPDGQVERVVAGRGDGPGQFADLGYAALMLGDTLAAIDTDRPRLTMFDPGGGLANVADLSLTEGQFALPLTVARAGAVLGFAVIPFDVPTESHSRDSLQLVIYPSTATPGQPLIRLPFYENWISSTGNSEPIPFAPRGTWTTRLDGFVTGTADTTELRVWSRSGDLQEIVRWSDPPRAVSSADRDNFQKHRMSQLRNDNARGTAQVALAQLPWPQHMPAYESLIADDSGNIWVERYRPPWEVDAVWTVIDSAGTWLGDMQLPERFRPMHIKSDAVLGVWRDTDNVEFVHAYRLRR